MKVRVRLKFRNHKQRNVIQSLEVINILSGEGVQNGEKEVMDEYNQLNFGKKRRNSQLTDNDWSEEQGKSGMCSFIGIKE